MVKSYLSFILRAWRVGVGQQVTCRASLEDILTGDHRAFTDLDGLFAYLRGQAKVISSPDCANESGTGAPAGPNDTVSRSGEAT